MPAGAKGSLQPTKDIIKWANEELDLSYREIASLLDVDESSVQRWVNEENPPSRSNFLSISNLQTFKSLLEMTFPEEDIRNKWIYYAQEDLNGQTPYSLLQKGELDTLIQHLSTFQAGAST